MTRKRKLAVKLFLTAALLMCPLSACDVREGSDPNSHTGETTVKAAAETTSAKPCKEETTVFHEPEVTSGEAREEEINGEYFMSLLEDAVSRATKIRVEKTLDGEIYAAESEDISLLNHSLLAGNNFFWKETEPIQADTNAASLNFIFEDSGYSFEIYDMGLGVLTITDEHGKLGYFSAEAEIEAYDLSYYFYASLCFDEFECDIFEKTALEFEAETAEEAAIKFCERERFWQIDLSPGNYQKIVDYSVIEYKVVKTAEDDNAVIVESYYLIKPEVFETFIYGGSMIPQSGKWTGWISSNCESLLQRQDNGMWKCTGSGWGYELPE